MEAKPRQSCGLQDALELMGDVAVIAGTLAAAHAQNAYFPSRRFVPRHHHQTLSLCRANSRNSSCFNSRSVHGDGLKSADLEYQTQAVRCVMLTV